VSLKNIRTRCIGESSFCPKKNRVFFAGVYHGVPICSQETIFANPYENEPARNLQQTIATAPRWANLMGKYLLESFRTPIPGGFLWRFRQCPFFQDSQGISGTNLKTSHQLLTGAGFYVRNHFPVPSWEDVEEEYEFEVLTASGTPGIV
jgi:hypothetical protein